MRTTDLAVWHNPTSSVVRLRRQVVGGRWELYDVPPGGEVTVPPDIDRAIPHRAPQLVRGPAPQRKARRGSDE